MLRINFCDPSFQLSVPVIGGHAGTTILPLLSQVLLNLLSLSAKFNPRSFLSALKVPGAKFSDADINALTFRIQFGG